MALAAAPAPVEYGIDRSNMSTQWTLAWPQEPSVSPFLAAEYNEPGNFEARRVAVLDGIARIHAQWFRDGFGKGPPELFVDLVHLVHARGMKLLAVFGAAASDYPAGAFLSQQKSGCQWGAYDADSPTGAEWAKHQWKWFLSPGQVQTFVRG